MKKNALQIQAARNRAAMDQIWATIRELKVAMKIMGVEAKDGEEFSEDELQLMRLCTVYVQHRLLNDCDEKIKDCFR